MTTLDELLFNYNTLQEQESSIKEQKEQIKSEIIAQLAASGQSSYITTDGSLKGTASMRTNIKYDDELAIIEYLKNNGMASYLKTTIDTTNFNKTLKSSQQLQESLAGKYSVSESPTLTVKQVL